MIIILKRKGKLLAVIVYIQHGRTVCGNSGLFDTFKLPQFRSHVQIVPDGIAVSVEPTGAVVSTDLM